METTEVQTGPSESCLQMERWGGAWALVDFTKGLPHEIVVLFPLYGRDTGVREVRSFF